MSGKKSIEALGEGEKPKRQSVGGEGRKGSYADEEEYGYENDEEATMAKKSSGSLKNIGAEKKSDSGEEDDGDDEDEDDLAAQKADQAAGDTNKTGKEDKAKRKKKELSGYKIRPDLEEKFRPGLVQVLIEKIVRDNLDGQAYEPEEMPKLVKVITAEIQHKVKSQKYNRYKLVTCVVLGERRGEGVCSATRCVWDSEADCLATYTFLSETVFCCATVYGIYYY